MTISERLFKILGEQGISGYRLSKMTGIPAKTISDWHVKKTNPGADKIMPICEALGISPETLLTGKGREEIERPDFIDPETGAVIEQQIIRNYRSFSEDKKSRMLAYINMLENTKEPQDAEQ